MLGKQAPARARYSHRARRTEIECWRPLDRALRLLAFGRSLDYSGGPLGPDPVSSHVQ